MGKTGSGIQFQNGREIAHSSLPGWYSYAFNLNVAEIKEC